MKQWLYIFSAAFLATALSAGGVYVWYKTTANWEAEAARLSETLNKSVYRLADQVGEEDPRLRLRRIEELKSVIERSSGWLRKAPPLAETTVLKEYLTAVTYLNRAEEDRLNKDLALARTAEKPGAGSDAIATDWDKRANRLADRVSALNNALAEATPSDQAARWFVLNNAMTEVSALLAEAPENAKNTSLREAAQEASATLQAKKSVPPR